MEKQYTTLMRLISQQMETIAERAMEENKEKNDLKAYGTAKQMRENYAALTDAFAAEDYIPDKAAFANLIVGANIMVKGIEARLKKEQLALASYRTDLIPKLEAALKEPEKIEEIFTLNV